MCGGSDSENSPKVHLMTHFLAAEQANYPDAKKSKW